MIYDISPPISPRLAVWPGDTPPSRQVLCDIERGDNITLSTLHGTVHLGSHADAPSHYGRGPAIHERDLDYYLGPCQVMRLEAPRATRLTLSMLPEPVMASRLLLATGTYADPERFTTDFAALSVELIDFLHTQGVVLIGLDTPSVDLFESKDLEAHQAFLRNDMAILEGLVLGHVPAGLYELIALPLRLEGFDASPVRAVLRASTKPR
ncbi:MAG: cyclase family protein [Gemmataceae bacterium]